MPILPRGPNNALQRTGGIAAILDNDRGAARR